MNISSTKQLLIICLLGLSLLIFAGMHPARVGAAPNAAPATAPLHLQSCTLPATVTTADQLYDCITAANAGSGGTITLGADIDLTTLTTSPLPQITSEITMEGAGYVIDGGYKTIFRVQPTGNLIINQATLQKGWSTTTSGAISNNQGIVTVSNSTLSGNRATGGNAGAIGNWSGTLTVINSTFSGNIATDGGAIYNNGTLTVINSTFSGNTATNDGGGIYNVDTLTVTNSTFSGNSVSGDGGAIFNNGGTATVTSSTFSGNSVSGNGGGIYNTIGTVHLAGSIFADNTGGTNCTNNGGTLNDNGYNLSDDGSFCVSGGLGSSINAALNLGVLADNGGPTLTHLPGAGSEAIGAIPYLHAISNNGETLACNSTTTDQTGNSRPINAGTACTSGAVEVAPTFTSLTIIKDASPAVGTDFDFTINSTPLTSYSGSTDGNPVWTRPNEGTTCTLSANSVPYHVQAFVVDTNGNYSMVSQQNYNGYLHLYQDSFNPTAQCANYLNGSDDTGLGSNQSEIVNQPLEAGRVYYLVTSGFATANAGTFTNYISGVGNAYALNDSFTLDDAAPDDSDGVDASITFAVEPDTYSITELLPDTNWALNSATCTGASGSVSLTGETLSVEVGIGEAVQCTFTNESLCPSSWTATTANELYQCITLANTNENPSPTADIITLGADIDLTTLTTSPLPQITSEITVEGAGYAIDGDNSVQLFYVAGSGNLTVNQATLQNGYAGTHGGAINNSGDLAVTNSTILNNSADSNGGGISNGGTVAVINSTFSGNSAGSAGGGIRSLNGGTMTVTNSTFSDNSATIAGGIFGADTVTMTNSTFSGNSADNGGGIYIYATTWHLAGNVFAAGPNGANCVNDGGTLNDNGYNLSDDNTCTNGGTGSATNATLNLGALADNGGPTLTHLPGVGSDAIGAIPNGTTISNNGTSWTCDQTSTDQRGESRPLNSGDGCTSGAVEVATPICPMVTTADELYQCIILANGNESPGPSADTITLGANIDLTTLTTSPLPQINSEITVEGVGYAVDGGNSVRIFYVGLGGNLTVNQTMLQDGFSSNGSGIFNAGLLTVTNSTFSGNGATGGGAIYNANDGIFSFGTVTVTNSTFTGNSAGSAGGAIFNDGGTLTVTNSTFSGNSANVLGGAIFNLSGTVTATNSTFSGNSASSFGGATYNIGTGWRLYLAGNIFVAGSSGANCEDSGGPIDDNGYNLSDDSTCTNGGAGSVNNATLNLEALADNGGPTLTHALLLGSDAIDAIPNVSCVTLTDQRGATRPQNTNCDSGAYELWEVDIGPISATELDLIWANAADSCVYDVYEETMPYFTPTTVTYSNQSSGVVYPQLGDVVTNYFYVVEAVCGGEVTAVSNEVGEFDFAIVPGS